MYKQWMEVTTLLVCTCMFKISDDMLQLFYKYMYILSCCSVDFTQFGMLWIILLAFLHSSMLALCPLVPHLLQQCGLSLLYVLANRELTHLPIIWVHNWVHTCNIKTSLKVWLLWLVAIRHTLCIISSFMYTIRNNFILPGGSRLAYLPSQTYWHWLLVHR